MGVWVLEYKRRDMWLPCQEGMRSTRRLARILRGYVYRRHQEEGLARPALRVRRYVRDPFMSERSW